MAPADGGTSPAAAAGKAVVIVPKPAPEPSEKAASTEEPTVQGLGAPLWVLLMSVLGAAVLTISMVVSWVRDPLDFADEKSLRLRLENIVRHQFYVIFAPIGSVFVYQALIVSQAASQPLAVGIAAFGSGMALNRLLDVALDAATKYWPKGRRRSMPSGRFSPRPWLRRRPRRWRLSIRAGSVDEDEDKNVRNAPVPGDLLSTHGRRDPVGLCAQTLPSAATIQPARRNRLGLARRPARSS